MAVTNRERVGKAIDLLAAGLQPFVERELKAALGDKWEEAFSEGAPRAARGKKAATPNLADPQLLLNAVWNQWNSVFARTLGHAERSLVSELREVRNRWAHNEAFSGNDAYRALVRIVVDSQSLLVKPDVAAAQLDAEATAATIAAGAASAPMLGQAADGVPAQCPAGGPPTAETFAGGTPTPQAKLGRFHGSVHLDPVRLGRDASRIAEEVVQHLTAIVGATVEITLDIQADLPDGAGDKLVRDITENCRTLRFDNHGFEEL